MRKTISLWTLGIAAMLASCSQNEEMLPIPTTDGQTAQVTISVQAPGAQTRAAVDQLKRYVCEVYEGATATGDATRYEQDNGNFAMTLKKNTAYTFLFWADQGELPGQTGTYYYDATNLKEVSVSGSTTADAYFGKIENKTITGADNAGFDVTLRHAVAKIVYENTTPFTEDVNKLKVTYEKKHKLDVATGAITEIEGGGTFATEFTINDKTQAELGVDYMFAPAAEGQLFKITTQLNAEPEKILTNIPLRLNHVTRIKGAFSNMYDASFTVSKEVEDMSGENKDF